MAEEAACTGEKRETPEPKTMTFREHFLELRRKLILSLIGVVLGSITAFIFYRLIIHLLFEPFANVQWGSAENQLYINTLLEGFLTKVKISVLSGIILSSPLHLYNLVSFIFPALKKREKRIVTAGLAVSFILIVFSVYYSYFKIIPISIRYLTGRAFIPEGVGLLLGYSKNIFFILQFIMAAVLVFQFPVILEILLILHVISRRALLRAGRYIIVGIAVLSAILTPPDFISQVSLAVPLIVMFFLTLLIAKIFGFGE